MSSEQSHDKDSMFVANSILLVREGEASQLGLLLELYRGYLLKIAGDSLSSEVAVKTSASDVVQETLLKASQNFPTFRGSSEPELKVWLRQILLHSITDTQRKFVGTDKRDASREVLLQDDLPEGDKRIVLEARVVKSPLSDLVAKENSSLVHDALQRLADKDRAVIEFRNFQMLGFAEIGLKLDCSEEAAIKRWARAIEAFYLELKDHAPNLFRTG